jgi:hypothetical protein
LEPEWAVDLGTDSSVLDGSPEGVSLIERILLEVRFSAADEADDDKEDWDEVPGGKDGEGTRDDPGSNLREWSRSSIGKWRGSNTSGRFEEPSLPRFRNVGPDCTFSGETRMIGRLCWPGGEVFVRDMRAGFGTFSRATRGAVLYDLEMGGAWDAWRRGSTSPVEDCG